MSKNNRHQPQAKADASKGVSTPAKQPEILLGSDIHEAVYDIDGKQHQLGSFVADAHALSGLSVEDWNKLPGEEREALIDAAVVAAGGPSALPPVEEQPPKAAEEHHAHAKVTMVAPEPGARCNLHGVEYEADENGHVHVPAHAADHLIPHGYKRKH